VSGFLEALEFRRRDEGEILVPPTLQDDRFLGALDLVPHLGQVLTKMTVRGRRHAVSMR
jgi:hypothetical protein